MNATFLDACFRKQTSYTPVWYMRQAGRYLPAYRKLKEKHNIVDIIRSPELAATVALQPVDILDVDAAILFADIMVPLLGIGVELDIVEHIGPVIRQPVRSRADVTRLRTLEPQTDTPYLLETIKILRKELKNRVPLIGFSAAPFTLASYLIEGEPTKHFMHTKSFIYRHTAAWHALMRKLTDIIIVYLRSQAAAGVHAVQVFDSWVGVLSRQDYQEYVLPYTREIFSALENTNIPLIHFGANTAGLIDSFSSVSCDVISIDWRMPLAEAWDRIGPKKAIQGNLDPALLLAEFPLIKKRVDAMFASLPSRQGYIFNLGHGVLQQTPVENLRRLTEYVHAK